MRKSKLTASEIEEQELGEYTRKYKRSKAQQLMHVRDRGWVRLNNGVLMSWPVVGEWSAPIDGIRTKTGNNIPKGYFVLIMNGKDYLFDVDEFRKWLRWA